MRIEVLTNIFTIDSYGISGNAVNKEYAQTAFKLSGRMWEIVKNHNLKNKGLNIWIYEPNDLVFAGVELYDSPGDNTGLERKKLVLDKYAYYKHIGPYNLIRQAGLDMRHELKKQGFETKLPYIEIYGHWNADESKLETELFMSLE
jgi:hypothetical protein